MEKPTFALVRVERPEASRPYLGFGARFVEPDLVRIKSVHSGWFRDRLRSGLLWSTEVSTLDPDPGSPFRVIGVTKESEPWRWRDDRTYWFRDEAEERLVELQGPDRGIEIEFEIVSEENPS